MHDVAPEEVEWLRTHTHTHTHTPKTLCLRALASPSHSVRDRPLLSEACQLDTLTHKIPPSP